jgi:hypothetical protein
VEGQVEGLRKENNEAEERARKYVKEKDEVKSMEQKTQAPIQKLHNEMPKVLIVVEATMEEHVLNIGEFIKGFQSKTGDLHFRSTPGTPPEAREGRERTMMKSVANIKKVEEECAKLCKESA